MSAIEMSPTKTAESYADLKLLIGGEWTPLGNREHEPVMNPATGECIGVLPHASKADLDRALDAAEQAYPVWRDMSPQDRGKILKRAADLMHERAEHIARLATIEEGKTIHEARLETAWLGRHPGMVRRRRPQGLWPRAAAANAGRADDRPA